MHRHIDGHRAETENNMLNIKKVGYKPGVYGIFYDNKAISQPGSKEDMEAILRAMELGKMPRPTVKRGRVVAAVAFSAIWVFMFVVAVMLTNGCAV
jgi:hypothetical protein